MSAKRKKIETIADLRPDPRNANRGTERGVGMLEHSLRTYGAGRSIVVSAGGRVIAGNKTLERAADLGLDIVVVPSDGKKLVVVQRTDLEDGSKEALEVGIADNRASQVGLDWDVQALEALMADNVDLSAFFRDDELVDLFGQPPDSPEDHWKGMPEYQNEDKTAFRTIYVHFQNADGVAAFARLVEQTITDKTKFIWFPFIHNEPLPMV